MAAKKRIETLVETEDGVSVIGKETYFKGNLNVKGSLRIDGSIEGNVAQSHCVVIGKNGKVKGDVSADNIVIAGSVEGRLCITDFAELQAGSLTCGDIRAHRLLIEEGACFNGSVTMGGEPGEKGKHDPEQF